MQRTWSYWINCAATFSQESIFSGIYVTFVRFIFSNSSCGFFISSRTLLRGNPSNPPSPCGAGSPPMCPCSVGCVAVQRTTEQPKSVVSDSNTPKMGFKYSGGNIWASSKIITEFAILWIFLHLLVFAAKSDSNNCTLVVTTIGASQFSTASFDLVVSLSGSKLEWCSRTTFDKSSSPFLNTFL